MLKYFFVLVFAVSFLLSTNNLAQEEMDQNAQMNAWMEYMTPGPVHEQLAKSVGEWKTTSKWWMDPAGEPMVTDGLATMEMILGGRYQKSTHTSEVMGMPMEGMSLVGYDNATEEFTAIWIDNLGTGTSVAKGKYDESTNSITMDGTMVDPMTKQDISFRQVMTFLDDDHHVLEIFVKHDGEEFKSMEIDFLRQ